MSRLVVVSNRVAPIFEGKPAAGGLAVAVHEALEQNGGLWFGWSGNMDANPEATLRVDETGSIVQATVAITRRDHDEFYRGYSNSTLWPLCHYRLDLMEQNRTSFEGYQRVNRFFAKMLMPLIKPGDLIWVHDYHLIPLGQELRALGCKNRLGFFLHIPFPPPDILLACTEHKTLVQALCSYDVVGFQTENDAGNFTGYVHRISKGEVSGDGFVTAFGRRLQARAFPIGVYPDALRKVAEKAASGPVTVRLMRSLHGRPLMIGVDRLDYSKGLDNRFSAFERFLETNPKMRSAVTFLQITPPSRSAVATYREIRGQLEGLAGHINGRFTELDWVPLRYLNKNFARADLVGFLRNARVGIVTPLRDGMNLVAKEYVAAQDPEAPGALVLSQFAGAAAELDAAILVNPYDIQSIADGMQTAFQMSLDERRVRWEAMNRNLRKNDLGVWRDSFIKALTDQPTAAMRATV